MIKKLYELGYFDYKGFIYFTVSIFSLLLAISQGKIWGWGSLKILLLGIIALIFGILFYIRDHKIDYPMINFKLFKIREFTLGSAAVMLSYMTMFTDSVLLPFYMQEILNFNPMKTGLVILSYASVLSITAPLAGRYAGRQGSKIITRCGVMIYVISLLIFITFNEKTSTLAIVCTYGFMGMGNGLFQSPSNNAILSKIRKCELGIASGILSLARNMGQILGVAITITAFTSFKTSGLAQNLAYNTAFLNAFHYTMMIGVLFGLTCFTFAFFAYINENISRQT